MAKPIRGDEDVQIVYSDICEDMKLRAIEFTLN